MTLIAPLVATVFAAAVILIVRSAWPDMPSMAAVGCAFVAGIVGALIGMAIDALGRAA